MAEEDDRLLSKITVLESWKRLLASSAELAEAKAQAALRLVADTGLHTPYDLARFYSQMMNGAATPEDFTGGISCRHSIASS